MTMTKIINREFLSGYAGISEDELIKYSLGGLMYTPAHSDKAADFLTERRYAHLRSLALCLEDAIADGTEKEAIAQTALTFRTLGENISRGMITREELPYLFVRVKNSSQIDVVYEALQGSNLLTGFIFPKFDEQNAQIFLEAISKINENADNILYGMPIIESSSVADVRNRVAALSEIRDITDAYRNLIINIRIGGNDFCSRFGIRRRITDTIYDISAVSSIIGDIINVFASDYVVSAPVWDYFQSTDSSDTAWAEGLKNETEKDIINGLTGKTAIHPSQLEIIDSCLAVSETDFRDARSILEWDDDKLAVCKGSAGNRMNEKKVHSSWARKILIRAAVYGIREEKGVINA